MRAKLTPDKIKNLTNTALEKHDPETRIKKFRARLEKYVCPLLIDQIGDLVSIEGTDDELYKKLDMYCGIDGKSKFGDNTRLLSFRFSDTKKDNGSYWETFTFGEKEYKDKKRSIENKAMIPEITIETSFNTKKSVVSAIRYAGVREIITACERYSGGKKFNDWPTEENFNDWPTEDSRIQWRVNSEKENKKFLAVDLNWLIEQGVQVRTWTIKKGWDGPPLTWPIC